MKVNKFSSVNARKKTFKKGRVTFVVRLFVILFCSAAISINVNAAGGSVEQRIQRLERVVDNQTIMEMMQSVQSLQREVSELRGDVEVLSFELGKMKTQQKDIYLDLDQRIQNTNQSVANLRSAPLIAGAPDEESLAEGDNDVADDASETLGEQESYRAALTILKSGRYNDAIQAYQMFLITYPESSFASNAQYWMAEAYYVLKDFQSALVQFKKVISAYPDSRKVADAQLKIGFAYCELKEWANAQTALEKVVTDYSSSTAARLAQRRIQKMKLEGNI